MTEQKAQPVYDNVKKQQLSNKDSFERIMPDATNQYSVMPVVIKGDAVVGACKNIVEVELPPYVRQIDADAFRDCTALERIIWTGDPPQIDRFAFMNCPKLKLPASFFSTEELPHDSFSRFMPADPTAMANAILRTGKRSLYNQKVIEYLTHDNAVFVTDELFRIAESVDKITDPEFVLRFMVSVLPLIGKDRAAHAITLLRSSAGIDKYDWLWGKYEWLLNLNSKLASANTQTFPTKGAFTISDWILGSRVDNNIMEKLPSVSHVIAAAYSYAEMYSQGRANPKEYKKDALCTYVKNEMCDKLAASLNHSALMQVLRKWQSIDGQAWNQRPEWYAPYAAFANEEELTSLISALKMWEKDKDLREQIVRVRGAVLLNDTVTAMRYADSIGLLDRYAEMRGTDADTIRDNIISDFGLDANGKRSWMLAGREITAILNPDLSIKLLDEDGKALKTIPKKGTDSEEYEMVKKEFASLKKSIKPTAKTRNDKIFADFLSGRTRPGKDWKRAYLGNPVLRILARLIVWEQGGTTFVLDVSGRAKDVNGNAYEVTDDPVAVAHPMEMSAETVKGWQKYFTDNGLKQPFEQVWEPIVDASMVKPGRYDGCTIPLFMLMNKEKHGIIMEGREQIALTDCTAGLKCVKEHHEWYNNEFEISDFNFMVYNRQVNHIVVHLDKGTVSGRIKKDDISAAQWFDRFTLAQITDFIKLAQDNDAANVLAQLMDYKNLHYSEFDPMDEFTLDLL